MGFPYSSGDVLTAADLNASSGLVFIKSQTIGSGVSSVTVTNAFGATFENYRIVGHVQSHSTGTTGRLQLGIGGTLTTTGYYWGHVNVTTGGSVIGVGGANSNYLDEVTVLAPDGSAFAIDVISPNLPRRTNVTSAGSDIRTGGNPFRYMGGFHNGNTAFTSFALVAAAGVMTGGAIRVYGYNNG